MPAADLLRAPKALPPGLNSSDLFNGLSGLSRVAVAVSGGSDSLALLHLVAGWAGGRGIEVQALTVDHGLRHESAGEALQVAGWCSELGVPHHILKLAGEKPRSGIQAWARQARYDAMTRWCAQYGFTTLLTAHTMDDQAETVVMRARRTTSAKALAGIWPQRNWHGVAIVRPLLSTRRTTLRSYLADQGWGWIEDPSNSDLRFERVQVRRELEAGKIPALANRAAQALQEVERRAADARAWLKRFADISPLAVITLPRLEFRALGQEQQDEVLSWCLTAAGDGNGAAPHSIDLLRHWISTESKGRRTLAGALVNLRKNTLLILREAGRIPPGLVMVPAAQHLVWDGRFSIQAPAGTRVGPQALGNGQLCVERLPDMPIFVQAALPALHLADGRVLALPGGEENAVSATLCERFWL